MAVSVELPWEMISEILCRLSVKDLLRYRSVCKEWCSIIDGPDFIRMHLRRDNLGIFVQGPEQLLWVDLDALDSDLPIVRLTHPCDESGASIGIIGCSKGLMVVGSGSCSNKGDMAIWNPCTRRYRLLSYNTNNSIYRSDVIGFGYDSLNEDHKLLTSTIISVPNESVSDLRSCSYEYNLYSVKTKTWKRLGNGFSDNYGYAFGYAAVNNALYWILIPKLEQHGSSTFIFSFDLATEQHSKLSMPSSNLEKEAYNKVVELGGCLCVVSDYRKPARRFDFWLMKHRESAYWTKLFSVEPSNIGIEAQSLGDLVTLTYNNTRDHLLLYINYRRFIMYDIKTKTAKDVRFSGIPESFGAIMCVSSLVGIE